MMNLMECSVLQKIGLLSWKEVVELVQLKTLFGTRHRPVRWEGEILVQNQNVKVGN
jgi:hypothetical protein